MWTVREIELAVMSKDLKGKTIQVDERGTIEGVVVGVESNEDGFVVAYVVDGSQREAQFGGSWNHGIVTMNGDKLNFDVAHIGTAVIQF